MIRLEERKKAAEYWASEGGKRWRLANARARGELPECGLINDFIGCLSLEPSHADSPELVAEFLDAVEQVLGNEVREKAEQMVVKFREYHALSSEVSSAATLAWENAVHRYLTEIKSGEESA